jgi:hypothetical protein
MTYIPKSEEQLAKEGLLEEGTYDFEVIDTNDAPSKKGNDMFTLILCVFDSEGGRRNIFDYIALGTNFGERKLRRAAQGCGLIDIYTSGDLKHHTFMGATGKVLVKQRDGTPDYPLPKNVVADYLPRDDAEPTQPKPARDIINDDIPFAWVAALLIPLASIIVSRIV